MHNGNCALYTIINDFCNFSIFCYVSTLVIFLVISLDDFFDDFFTVDDSDLVLELVSEWRGYPFFWRSDTTRQNLRIECRWWRQKFFFQKYLCFWFFQRVKYTLCCTIHLLKCLGTECPKLKIFTEEAW